MAEDHAKRGRQSRISEAELAKPGWEVGLAKQS